LINLKDLDASQELARALTKHLLPGTILYLEGDLGAGKTTLVRAMLDSLGYNGKAKSPTFTLVEPYNFLQFDLYHFDLYRLGDPSELDFIGFRDYINDNSVCIFEWADKGEGVIPKPDLVIKLDFAGEGRTAEIRSFTERGEALENGVLND